jgi:hypothetical protein
MGGYLYYIYVSIAVLFILFCLGLAIYAVISQRQIIYFEVLDEETMKPVKGMDIFGEYSFTLTERGFTASGEPVFVPGMDVYSATKKIGKTDENGVFKKIYYINKYSTFFFPVENPVIKFPNFFTAGQLQLNNKNDKIKTITLNKDGVMKLLNPNELNLNYNFKIG